jgi:hypothetical protein
VRLLASDIEAKGFYDAVNTWDDVHCFVSIDISTNEVFLFHNHPEFDNVVVVDTYDNKEYKIPPRTGSLADGLKFWEEESASGSKLVVHNAHTYDRVIINKLSPDNSIPFDSWWDTYVQSKVQWFERPTPKGCKGAHGLQAYGVRCGVNKPEVKDWQNIDAFKLHRCIEDCKIQAKTYLMLEKERTTLKDKYGIDFTQALKIESLYAAECAKQEIVGAKVDVAHIKRCIADLDTKLAVLTDEIEPQLPPTVKPKGTKVSRKEIAELLGYNPDNVKDTFIQRKVGGEVQTVVEKPYVKPSVNFTKKEKITFYQGFHMTYGFSVEYKKKKDLTEWIKANYPETKPKDWGIEKREDISEVLNANTCSYFEVEPTDTDLIVGPHTKVEFVPSRMTQNEVVKGFLIKLGWNYADEWNLKTDSANQFIKAEVDTEVRWPPKAAPEHQLVKLVRKGELMVSSPKLGEDDYEQLPEGVGKKIAEYNTYKHRRGFLSNVKDPENKGLLSYVRSDGRIPCGVNNFGTRSGRGAQRVWVNAPSESALYGEEIRKCIVPESGKVLVGEDMKSAQLSIAAYYAINEAYYHNVASGVEEDDQGNYVGSSAHCVNARMFGLVSESEWQEAVRTQNPSLCKSISLRRKGSKGGSFAVIFGASGPKVAKTLGIPDKEGSKRRKQFLAEMGLDEVSSWLSECESKYKHGGGFFIPLAFGYWLWNNSSHKSINTIVQGYEALAQKMAIIKFNQVVDQKGWVGVNKVLDVHDEFLVECPEDMANDVGKLMGKCYTWAGEQIFKYHVNNPEHFANYNPPKFAIDLDGGFKVGDNYYAVH